MDKSDHESRSNANEIVNNVDVTNAALEEEAKRKAWAPQVSGQMSERGKMKLFMYQRCSFPPPIWKVRKEKSRDNALIIFFEKI